MENKEYSSSSVKTWFIANFPVTLIAGYEAQCPCPTCGHPSFYFNYQKQIGYCHRASCGYKPLLRDLIRVAGVSPDAEVYPVAEEPVKVASPPIEVSLPKNKFLPIVYTQDDCITTSNLEAYTYLHNRNISSIILGRFDVRVGYDGRDNRIYVPIYEGGIMRNYVARLFQPSIHNSLRYKYAPGAKTSDFIFNWDEIKDRKRGVLTLVENTFVAMSYWGNKYNVTTNFGSNLSDVQADKIKNSNVRQVLIAWDEGTDNKAHKAVQKLRDRQVKAGYIVFKGQPDNWTHTSFFTMMGIGHFGISDQNKIRIEVNP